MGKEMDKGKNMMKKEKPFLKVIIQMGKEMDQEKNIMIK
jgi:hypothetical protein